MHAIRSAIRSVQLPVIVAFVVSLAASFMLLSSAAHGDEMQAQPAVYHPTDAAPVQTVALTSPALQLVAAPVPLSLQAAALPKAGAQADTGVEPTPAPTLPPAADIPDPEQDPGGFIDSVRAFWANGGKVPTVLAVLIGVMAVLKRRIDWLGVGWRATAVSIAGVLVATLLDTWFSSGAAGNIWAWLFGGVVGVVNFIANPRPNQPVKA